MNHVEIAPAVYVNALPADKFKTNYLSVSVIHPLSAQAASNASLLAFVLKRGSAAYPGIDAVNRRLEELYGARFDVQIRKKGEAHIISFFIDFVDGRFIPGAPALTEDAAAFLKEILFQPLLEDGVFSADIVETEKRNLLDLLAARSNEKTAYAVHRCGELMAQGQPFEVCEFGTCEEIEKITPSSLFSFYKQALQSAVFEIFAIGAFSQQRVASLMADAFAADRRPVLVQTSYIARRGGVREYTESFQVEQAKLSLGYRLDTDEVDFTACTLFLILFGASPHSMLFLNVRENLSLCYYCSARLDKLKRIMIVYSGVLPENIGVAREEIGRQLEAVQQGAFSDQALDAAKYTYINNLKSSADSMYNLEDYALTQNLLGLPTDLDAVIGSVERMDRSAVQRAAQSFVLDTVYVLRDEKGGSAS